MHMIARMAALALLALAGLGQANAASDSWSKARWPQAHLTPAAVVQLSSRAGVMMPQISALAPS